MKEPTKEYIVNKCNIYSDGRAACLKRAVYCMLISQDNKEVFGSNWMNNLDVSECPRANYPTGEGYHLCKDICKQDYHAEIDAVINAQKCEVITYGAKMYLTGHDYCCKDCLSAMKSAGVKYVKCLDSGREYEL